MPVKAKAAALESGAEILSTYRAARARLMGARPPANPGAAPAVATPSADAPSDPVPRPTPPRPRGPPAWLAKLTDFNEELRAHFAIGHGAPPTVDCHVRAVVAAHFGITVAEIVGRQQARRCARPRQIAMYICARHVGLSLPCIGAVFGRDHSTVHHAVRAIAARRAANPALAAEIDALVEKCRAGAPA